MASEMSCSVRIMSSKYSVRQAHVPQVQVLQRRRLCATAGATNPHRHKYKY